MNNNKLNTNVLLIGATLLWGCNNPTRTRQLSSVGISATPAPTEILLPVEVAATYLEGSLSDEGDNRVGNAMVYFEGNYENRVQADTAGNFRLAMNDANKGKRLIIVKEGSTSLSKVVAFLDIPSVAVNNTISLGKLVVKNAGTITGQIKLLDGTTRAGILVYVPGTNFTTTTDAQGNYSITGLPEGNWKVNFSGTELAATAISEVQIVSANNTEILPQIIMPATQLVAGIALAAIDYNTNSTSFDFNFTADIAFFMASEDANFNNATWTGITSRTIFTFAGNGSRTVYFKFKSPGNQESISIAFPVSIIAPAATPTTAPTATPTAAPTATPTAVPSKLVFLSSSPLKVATNSCAGPFTIEAQNDNNTAMSVTPGIVVELLKSLGNSGTFYDVAGCAGSAVTQISMATNQSQAQFWFKNTTAESATITSSAMGNTSVNSATRGVTSIVGYAPDTWSGAISTLVTRKQHSAIWTGSEMIVWGGTADDVTYSNDGWRYNPITNTGTVISTTNAPSVRSFHSAVWTGSEMIIWGGSDEGMNPLNTGGSYNPVTNSWDANISTTNAPLSRREHSAIWTGTEMIVWGGYDTLGLSNNGKRYNRSTNTWGASISTTNAPSIRHGHTAIWTGTEMVVWGGNDLSGFVNTGRRYNANTDTWGQDVSNTNAPSARWGHSAIWTGSEMIVWGGLANDGSILNTGKRYKADTNSWISDTSLTNAPLARFYHCAVWNGLNMLVFGGGFLDGVSNEFITYYTP